MVRKISMDRGSGLELIYTCKGLTNRLIIIMEHHTNLHKSNIRYAKISLKKRKQLVKEVIEDNHLISKTAKRLNLKLSTAKLIVKRYKIEGTFFESKTEKVKRLQKELNIHGNEQNIPNTDVLRQNSLSHEEQSINVNQHELVPMIYFPPYFCENFIWPYPVFQNMMFYHY